jgi:hypothetical protein
LLSSRSDGPNPAQERIHNQERTMSIARESDEPQSVAAEALRLAQIIPHPELAAILREVAEIFGTSEGGQPAEIA